MARRADENPGLSRARTGRAMTLREDDVRELSPRGRDRRARAGRAMNLARPSRARRARGRALPRSCGSTDAPRKRDDIRSWRDAAACSSGSSDGRCEGRSAGRRRSGARPLRLARDTRYSGALSGVRKVPATARHAHDLPVTRIGRSLRRSGRVAAIALHTRVPPVTRIGRSLRRSGERAGRHSAAGHEYVRFQLLRTGARVSSDDGASVIESSRKTWFAAGSPPSAV